LATRNTTDQQTAKGGTKGGPKADARAISITVSLQAFTEGAKGCDKISHGPNQRNRHKEKTVDKRKGNMV
jgi:hypothetical protein